MIAEDFDWNRLRCTGEVQSEAISELRSLLLRGLSKSLNHRYGQPFFAEDIVQEALLKILESLDRFEGRSKFKTWAMTIATRVGISALRRKHHDSLSLEGSSEDGIHPIDVAAPSDDREQDEGLQTVLHILQRLIESELTDKQRIALRASLAGDSTDGIALLMGTNRNAVYKLIHDARMKLKDGFTRTGITSEDVAAILA
jgi:RNA polymerase sigma factor (sigma-70 family)